MKTSVSAFALALIVVGCGSGAPPEESESFNPGQRSTEAASNGQRQAVIDACKPPFTGPNGTGGRLTRPFCGVALPTSGADRTPQRWWDFAGCLADHPNAFSNSCKNLFRSTCGNGDDCICNPGYVLDEDDRCIPAGSCDNDNECPAVAHGTNKCSSHVEHDPPQGHCVLTCNSGFVPSNGTCVPACVPTTCAAQGKNCGQISNGCGGTLSCGTCTAPQTCGGAGTANVCGAPASKRVFVTSATYNGNLGGLAGADAKCQALASAAALTGTYKAWLSTSTINARDRVTQSGVPYTLVDGTVVATNFTQLTSGTLLHAINKTQSNGAAPASDAMCNSTQVWTDTFSNGTGDLSDCDEWTNSGTTTGTAILGDYTVTDGHWTYHCLTHLSCNQLAPLYCLEQ